MPALPCAVVLLWSGLLATAGVGLLGCGDPIEHSDLRGIRAEAIPTVPHPVIERDLPEIAASGVIRMVTRYNSSSYFIHKGGQAGFDYELFQRYAAPLGLAVQVVIPEADEDLISLLNSGRGDVICAGLTLDSDQVPWAATTRPTNFVKKVVVLQSRDPRPNTLGGLAGLVISVPEASPIRDELYRLKRSRGIRFFVQPIAGPVTTEELIARVGRGELEATVADDLVVRIARNYLEGFRTGPVLGEERPAVWLVRENCPELKSSLNEYLRGHFRVSGSGATRRSQTYGIIHDRYFGDVRSIRGFQEVDHRPERSGRLSPWDEIVREESERADLDWRLVTALMYQESRFDPQAVSSAGALGLMQVLPQWAGPQADSLFVPAANIRAGVRLLSETFASYAYLDSLTRLRFTLATYHAGYGHVTDARRLAIDQGRDPNRWEDSLEWSLERLMQRRYFNETRHGFYRGAITVAYVQSILDRYRTYMRLVPREGPPLLDAPLARGRDPDRGGESPSGLTGEVTEPMPPPE